MAGIDFMAFANGMMQADKLNKEDETYWRKQATEDIAAKNLERDQAYREQVQGYGLNNFEDFQQNKEASALSAQAYDAYVQKAKALGVPLHQVIMDSPAFELPNATPAMQALFNAKLNNAIQTNVIAPLRVNRDFESANSLIGRLGLPGQGGENPMLSFGDPEKEAAFIASKMPYLQRSETGQYQYQDLIIPPEQAMLLANSTPAAALAAINVMRQQKTVNATTQTQQTQLQASGKATLDRTKWDSLAEQARAGVDIKYIHPEDRETYATMMGATVTGSGSPPITASVEAATMPARQSTTPTAAMPVRQSTTPTAAMPGVLPAGINTSGIQADLPSLQQARENINATTADLIAMAKEPQYFTPDKIAAARAVLAKQEQVLRLVQSANVAGFKAGMSTPPKTQPSYVDVLNSRYR